VFLANTNLLHNMLEPSTRVFEMRLYHLTGGGVVKFIHF
jgi:hypothetical protein